MAKRPKLSKQISYIGSKKLSSLKEEDIMPPALTRIHELERKAKKNAVGRTKVDLKELANQIQILKQRVAKNPNDYKSQLELKRLKANYSSIVSKRKQTSKSI